MNAAVDFAALETRQQAAWSTGDDAVIGTTLQIVGESLAEACDLKTDEHFVDVVRTWYGPVNKAFAAQTPEKADALADELADLLNGLNRAGPGTLVVPAEYLEVVVIRS